MLDSLVNGVTTHVGLLKHHAWIVQVFIVVTITLLSSWGLKLAIRKYILPRTEKSNNIWDDALIRAIGKPLTILILLVGFGFAVQIAAVYAKYTEALKVIYAFKTLGIIAALTWLMVRFINEAEANLTENEHRHKALDKTTVYAIGKLLKASVLITATLVALQTFGIGISGLLAFGSIGGAAVAFSAKDLLANFFGGLIIYLDRPFAVGDWIRSPDRQIEGTVEYIGWRLCRIRTFDKRPLYVPNSVFNNISIENPSRMTNRRIKTYIGLRYEDAAKVHTILKDVEDMLKAHQEIDASQTLMVNLVEFGPSSLNFMVYTFTKTTNWEKFQAVQQEVFLKIIDIILGHGAECAFPNLTLHVPEGLSMKTESIKPLEKAYA